MKQETKFKQTEIGMIPEDWDVEVFSNVIAINPKRDIKKGTTARKISMQNLIEFKRKIDGFALSEFKGGSKFQNEDTLMARITPCLENGKTAYVDILEDNEIAFGSTEFIVLSGKDNLTRNDFVYYLAISPKIRRIAIQSMTGTSGRQRIQADLLGDVEIGIPSLEEQKSIAKILSDFDSKIELLQKQNKTLEAIGQAIFKHWFVDFEFPNEEGKSYKSSGGEMVFNEELEKEIPMGWDVKPIKELCKSISNGGTPRRMESAFWNGNINWYKTGELFNNPLLESEEKITEKGLNNSACKLWDENTILVALYASPTVGRLGILKTKATSNQACSGLIAKDEIGYPFLFYTLLSKRGYFNNLAVGAAQQNINAEIVKETKVIKPGSSVLDRFNLLTFNAFDKRTHLLKEVYILSQIRDSLLPKLMSGKIRVPVEVE